MNNKDSIIGCVRLTLAICAFFLSQSAIQAQPASTDFLVELESVEWNHGAEKCEDLLDATDYQEWQQVRYLPQSYLFRQNKCSHYEGPFIYLFLGEERALLIDSGATEEGGLALRELIRDITDLPIVLAHTHGHSDHRLGDGAFRGQEGMTVVDVGAGPVREYFGFANWPDEPAMIDLGGREIELLPIPGHSDDDLAFYDARSRLLITGDTLYPGRLYVRDWPEYRKSIARLADWIAQESVSFVMGTHIEMSARPNLDYPVGTQFQPDEHPLPLGIDAVYALRDKLQTLMSPERTPMGSFIIWPI